MASSPIDEIKNRLDVVGVIGGYIKLQKAGANYRARCPFHSEKTPSFFVSPARQIWHCFGCGKGGNIFNFVMEIEGVEFGDALRILAQKAGVELKRQPPELRTQRQRLYEICELATRFFEKQMAESSAGKEAEKYLLERGISEVSIKKWRLGYSPDTWKGLSDFLVSKGYQREEMERAGLAVKSETADNFYDRFRGRIIFPIFDLNSQAVGFTGRIFKSKDPAKYLNTPGTLLYDKSRILYGLDKAKVEIRKRDFCILVEGNTDAIMVSQADFENVAAVSGTALTPFQLKILKRYSDNLLIAFDMDTAGNTATKRGIDSAQSQGFNIKVVNLQGSKDPADIISKNPQEWDRALQEAKSILDFYFETAFSDRDSKKPEGKREISKILMPIIKRIPNKIEQSHWVQQLARKLDVKERDVEEELRKVKLESFDPPATPVQSQAQVSPKSRKELLEERLITLILKSPQSISLIEKKLLSDFSPQTQEILTNLKTDSYLNPKKFLPELTNFLNYLSLKSEAEEIGEGEIVPEIKNCLKEIQFLEIRNKLDEISKEIKKVEEEKDDNQPASKKKIEKLIQEFNLRSKSRGDLESAI